MTQHQTTLARPAWLDGAATPLGATRAGADTRFAVVAEADAVWIRLVRPGTLESHVQELRPAPGEPLVWTAIVQGDRAGWAYRYEIQRDGARLSDIVDPWARLVRNDTALVAHPGGEPVAPRPLLDPADAIIYELHVRDFTRDPACGVRPDWRGKYLGLSQAGTRLDGTATATGLDHILELGVNVVQLMPVHAFSLPYNPEYEWGYMPNDYNAPHPGYASGVEPDAPIRELKRTISALHQHGLRVTLDVVYNHTAEKWPKKLRSLMALAPRTFFRFKDDGTPHDGSACGNEFRSDSEHGRRFIVESVRYWVTEFGVDGFRFDLMGLIDPATMELVTQELHAIDPTILVYGEPWAGGPAGIDVNSKGNQRGRGWAVFNDQMRDGLRGEVFEIDDTGFLNAGTDVADVKAGIRAGLDHFAASPLETINYVECHDNHTLQDRLQITDKKRKIHGSEEAFDRMSRLAVLALMTSQGIPFIHSGQEFGRTKAGEDNTYNLGDQINNIRWSDKERHARRNRFYRDAIALRKAHPVFRLKTREHIDTALAFLDDDLAMTLPEGTIAFRLTDPTGEDAWAEVIVALNGADGKRAIPLPPPSAGDGWTVATQDGTFDGRLAAGDTRVTGELTLAPHTGAVLYRPR